MNVEVQLPLDGGYLRRECPLCRRQFKVLLTEGELTQLTDKLLESFMVEKPEDLSDPAGEPEEAGYTCPYCGQQAPSDSWWTQEQVDYFTTVVKNVMVRIMNEKFIRPMKRKFSRPGSLLQFRGRELKEESEWMAPEAGDLSVFDLPCCGRKIKLEEGWKGAVHCFFCGFPHQAEGGREGN